MFQQWVDKRCFGRLATKLACLVVLLHAYSLRADDIDIYRAVANIDPPLVHVVLDLRGGVNQPAICILGVDCQPPFLSSRAHDFLHKTHSRGQAVTATGLLLAVLSAVLVDPIFDNLRITLIMPNHPGNMPQREPTGTFGGATILSGYKRLGDSRAHLLETLQSIPLQQVPSDQVLQPREALYEWYRYLNGQEIALGKNTVGNFGEDNPVPDFDPGIISGADYVSPLMGNGQCPQLFGVVALLGPPGEDSDLNHQISRSLGIPQGADFSQVLTWMHRLDANVAPSLSPSIGVSKSLILATRKMSELATTYARASGGEAVQFLEQPAETEAALRGFLMQALNVESTLAAATMMSGLNAAGSLIDRYYLAMFQSVGGSRWIGNVKKYRLNAPTVGSGEAAGARLVDVRGAPVFETSGPDKGRIKFNALSFWTDVSSLPPGDGVTAPQGADGRSVNLGGAGQKIDGYISDGSGLAPVIGDINGAATRQIFVEPEQPGPFIPFNADQQTITAFRQDLDPQGLKSDAQLLDLVRWARGQDVDARPQRARGWLLGGVLHSRPLAVNYGASVGYSHENPEVRLFFGSTDGLFHIIEDTDVQGLQSGRERFAFYPRQLLGSLSQQRETSFAYEAPPHYGVDGAPAVLRIDRDGNGAIESAKGDEVFVYFGLRRGGAGYFALNASNSRKPPKLAWKITPGGDFPELGLGFSTPVVGRVKFDSSPRDVVIFAAGYNGGWNAKGTARIGKDLGYENDRLGNAIYVVDARTGELVWKAVRGATGTASERHYEHAELVDSIPSSVTAIKTEQGLVYRLYVGDTGGAVWRVDLPPGEGVDHRRDAWQISKLADLGVDAGEVDGSEERDLRFFHAPAVVRSYDETGPFNGIILQSGDRAHPLNIVAQNHIFYLKDRSVNGASVSSADRQALPAYTDPAHFGELEDQSDCVTGDEIIVEETTVEETTVDETTADGVTCSQRKFAAGWRLRLKGVGEKGLSSPIVDGGRVFATTYTPPVEASCAATSGAAKAYAVRLIDATALAGGVRVQLLGEGIPPGPIYAGARILFPGGGIDPARFGEMASGSTELLPSTAPQRYRVYWREPDYGPL